MSVNGTKLGDVAQDSMGCLGLVLSNGPKIVQFSDGTEKEAWTGIHLETKPEIGIRVGDPWHSQHPNFVTHLSTILSMLG